MLASDIIATIKCAEEIQRNTKLYRCRIKWFQRQNPPETIGVVYDEPAFSDFIHELEFSLQGKVNIPTARKILNNWYIYARKIMEICGNIKPFTFDADPIRFLIINDFRIDMGVFAREASQAQIAKTQQLLPKNSELYYQLKEVADKKFSNGPRGYYYPYILRVVAGFSEVWSQA